MGCVISPLLIVLVMEMILRRVENNTNKQTVPSMKAFMADVTNCRFKSIYRTTGDPPTGTFQMDSDEDKAF